MRVLGATQIVGSATALFWTFWAFFFFFFELGRRFVWTEDFERGLDDTRSHAMAT